MFRLRRVRLVRKHHSATMPVAAYISPISDRSQRSTFSIGPIVRGKNRWNCCSVIVFLCLGLLFVITIAMAWFRFKGYSEIEQNFVESKNHDHSSAVHVADTMVDAQRHTDRVAAIVEDRPLPNLIPIILHFHAILGPEWPIILYTNPTNAEVLLRSTAFTRAVTSRKIEIRQLPTDTSFDSHGAVSIFLTGKEFWESLAPYKRVLLFQADSILCAGATSSVDDFMEYDFVGAPIDTHYGHGVNGGLSLRNRELLLKILDQWAFPGGFEDQWFYARMEEMRDNITSDGQHQYEGGEVQAYVNLPDERTAGMFAVETIWKDQPLGYHQPHRWQGARMKEIMEYCPEVGMIAGSTFFGR
ncbi:hypothetical protein F4808DRAFT_81395 [Astrocystis sublimbata]|nr:hypothetical protein F4808DRAFT_81395 [Astrocystis sublimbata]